MPPFAAEGLDPAGQQRRVGRARQGGVVYLPACPLAIAEPSGLGSQRRRADRRQLGARRELPMPTPWPLDRAHGRALGAPPARRNGQKK